MPKKAIPYLIGILLVIFVFSGIMIVLDLSREQKQIEEFKELAALVAPEMKAETASPAVGRTDGEAVPTLRNLQPLFEKNEDCIGWICIEDTAVNYPVMHTPMDPERYLNRNFEKAYSTAGVPFLEGICGEACDNLILYGHNMRNGTMFSQVTEYRDPEFAAAHPVIQLETAQGLKEYTVFAVVQLKDTDDWYGFHQAAHSTEFDQMVATMQERSLYDSGLTPQYGQQLLTLSTCYGSAKNDRIVVIGFEA